MPPPATKTTKRTRKTVKALFGMLNPSTISFACLRIDGIAIILLHVHFHILGYNFYPNTGDDVYKF
jgi:hypothetical protein